MHTKNNSRMFAVCSKKKCFKCLFNSTKHLKHILRCVWLLTEIAARMASPSSDVSITFCLATMLLWTESMTHSRPDSLDGGFLGRDRGPSAIVLREEASRCPCEKLYNFFYSNKRITNSIESCLKYKNNELTM